MKLSDPKLGFVNSADCVDMPCDAKKKVIITDTDGSVFGTVRLGALLFEGCTHMSSIKFKNKL